MAIVKHRETWNPMEQLREMETRLSRMFGGELWSFFPQHEEDMAMSDWMPNVDIEETKKAYRIHAALPGIKKEDVHITCEQGVLTIRGDHKEVKEEKTERVHRKEIRRGHFMRRFTLPSDVDATKVDAKYMDGMLDISIPKTGEKSKVQEVDIH